MTARKKMQLVEDISNLLIAHSYILFSKFRYNNQNKLRGYQNEL